MMAWISLKRIAQIFLLIFHHGNYIFFPDNLTNISQKRNCLVPPKREPPKYISKKIRLGNARKKNGNTGPGTSFF